MEKYTIKLSSIGVCEVEINFKSIKRCYLRVYPDGKVAASVPHYFGQARIQKFIDSNSVWVERKLLNIAPKINNKIYYLGEEYPVANNEDENARHNFYESKKKEAYAIYRLAIDEFCNKYSCFTPKPSLKVRSMVSWGLYNKRKNQITMNLKLIQADVNSIRMVVFHELCHILEQNHSQKFYALLKMEYPDYIVIKKNLSKFNTRN